MKCHEARIALPHFLNDELSVSERALVQAHLTGCEDCFAELQTLNAMQRQVRAGLHVATERVESSPQAWGRLHATLQSKRTPPPVLQTWPAFFLRAVGAVFAMLSVMAGAAVLRPGLMGTVVPASEAIAPALATPTQPAQQNSVRALSTATHTNHEQLMAFLKTEPYQSVRAATAILFESELQGLKDFACRTCVRMQ